MSNRIGEICWHRVNRKEPWKSGWLLAWSTEREELRDGVGQSPAAVVESVSTGEVEVVFADQITFKKPRTDPADAFTHELRALLSRHGVTLAARNIHEDYPEVAPEFAVVADAPAFLIELHNINER